MSRKIQEDSTGELYVAVGATIAVIIAMIITFTRI